MTAFPLARSVTPVEGGVGGHIAQKVLETSPQSWAEADVKGAVRERPARADLDKGDKAGPVPHCRGRRRRLRPTRRLRHPRRRRPRRTHQAGRGSQAETRVVVVGDSDFASNRAVGIQGNREIFLNMANWLAQQEDLIAIRPKSPEDRPLTMTADQQRMVFYFTMFIVPALLFGNGVRVWWKRR